jgi:hypothetical protein
MKSPKIAYTLSRGYLIPYPVQNPTHVSFGNRFRYESRFLKKLSTFDPNFPLLEQEATQRK